MHMRVTNNYSCKQVPMAAHPHSSVLTLPTPLRCPKLQESIDRLESGLNKLHKVQGEVDVLVENAKVMAVQVEQKVASANVFAEQVCVCVWVGVYEITGVRADACRASSCSARPAADVSTKFSLEYCLGASPQFFADVRPAQHQFLSRGSMGSIHVARPLPIPVGCAGITAVPLPFRPCPVFPVSQIKGLRCWPETASLSFPVYMGDPDHRADSGSAMVRTWAGGCVEHASSPLQSKAQGAGQTSPP